jgi:hypothetical protein
MVEIERIVLPPLPNSPLGSPRVRPTGTLNLNPRQVQVIKGQEEERAGQAQLANLASRYNNRFNPELRAAITAQQELGRNSTAAADYVTQIGMERRKEEIQRGLLGVDQPNGLAGKAADVGADLARDQNTIGSLSGLLGDIDYRGILDQLVKTFQRPEMLTPGVNALTSFGMSGAALNQAEMAGAAAEQERMDKFAMEQIKNAPGATKPTTEITNLYKEMGVYQSGLNTFDKIKSILSKGVGTGLAGSTLNGLTNIAAAFNINLSPSAKKSINLAVAEIRTQLIASRAYGREANKDEQKLIRTLIPEAGTFSTIKELEEAYNNAAASMRRKANETNAIMTGVYGLKSYGSIVPNSPLFTRDNK